MLLARACPLAGTIVLFSLAIATPNRAAQADVSASAADSLATRRDSVASASADTIAHVAADSLARAVPDSLVIPSALAPGTSRRMADTVTVLPPVRVDETRAPVDTRGSATTVQVPRSGLVRFQPATVGDALNTVPGVDLVRTGAWSSQIAMRGLAGERVLLMVDGVRLNTGRGHGAQSSLIPIDRLDAVEISPGAASGAYGSDALGGVLNMVTHRSLIAPTPDVTAYLSLRGTAPGDQAAGTVRVRYRSNTLGAEVSAGVSRLRALNTPDSLLANSGFHDEDLVGRVQFQHGPFAADVERAHHAARDIGIPAFSTIDGNWATYPLQARDASRLQLGWAGRGWTTSVLASDQHYATNFIENTVGYDSLRGRRIATTTVESNDDIGSRQRGIIPEIRLGSRGNVVLGGEYRRETSGGPRTDDATTQNMSGAVTGTTSTTGASIPQSWRELWGTRLAASAATFGTRVDGGVRFDRYTSHADSIEIRDDPGHFKPPIDVLDQRWSAEGGLARPIGVVEPYVHVASGFRSPSLDERFYDDDIHGGLRVFGNRDLRAERSLSEEVGVRAAWERASVRVSAYRADVNDLISIRYLDFAFGVPRFQYQNISRARLDGLELVAQARAQSATLGFHAAFPRGRDLDTGNQITDVGAPKVGADLGLTMPHFVPQGRFDVSAAWTDAVIVDHPASEGEASSLPRSAFWVLHAQVGATMWGSRVTVAVRNLLNHRYREPLGFIDEPGRTVTLALQRAISSSL